MTAFQGTGGVKMNPFRSAPFQTVIRLLATIALFTVGVCFTATCQGRKLAEPFAHIIPTHLEMETATLPWFEGSYLDLKTKSAVEGVIEHHERACKGKDVKFWIMISVFESQELAAKNIAEKVADDIRCGIPCNREASYWLVTHNPDELFSYWIYSRPTHIPGDSDEHGETTEGVHFRVGRYVCHYCITRSFPNILQYYNYTDKGFGPGADCRKDLGLAIDSTIERIQKELGR